MHLISDGSRPGAEQPRVSEIQPRQAVCRSRLRQIRIVHRSAQDQEKFDAHVTDMDSGFDASASEQLPPLPFGGLGAARAQPPDSPHRVLIVKDEALIAMDLEIRLKTLGDNVVGVVDNYDEALVAFHRESPDIVLMEVNLADSKSGIEIAGGPEEEVGYPGCFHHGLQRRTNAEGGHDDGALRISAQAL